MTLASLKSRLTIAQILGHYGLKANKQGMLACPFHPDKTPSLQIYFDTNTAYCFSSNCKTHGKSMDVIDFIMHMLSLRNSGIPGKGISKHKAILKAKSLISNTKPSISSIPKALIPMNPKTRLELIKHAWHYYQSSLVHSKKAKSYLLSRGLSYQELKAGIGYNGGKLHLPVQCPSSWNPTDYKIALDQLGLIKASPVKGHQLWADKCLIFPLKNEKGEVVSFYGRSLQATSTSKHFYLQNRQGLYPCYPKLGTRKLILTESVIDALSLMSADLENENTSVLALYGTNGLNEEHENALESLEDLQEIILFFDGDEAGKKAVEKQGKRLEELLPTVKLSAVDTPSGEDVNSLLIGHEKGVFEALIRRRKALFVSNESSPNEAVSFEKKNLEETVPPQQSSNQNNHSNVPSLNAEDPKQLRYTWGPWRLHIAGGVELRQLNRLKINMHIRHEKESWRNFRDDANLYNRRDRQRLIRDMGEDLELESESCKELIAELTEVLTAYRLDMLEKAQQVDTDEEGDEPFSEAEMQAGMKLLKDKKLMRRLMKAYPKLGMIGEEKNAMLIFLIFLTRFSNNPLHVLIQGPSGSGKTWLLKGVVDILPKSQRIILTSISENSLYHSDRNYLKHKVLIIEDLDGVIHAGLAVRELMSNRSISKLTLQQDPQTGLFKQKKLYAEGPCSFGATTTHDKIYEDNANRSFLLQTNEGKSRTAEILAFQRADAAGLGDPLAVEKITRLIKAAQLQLKPIKVIIPFGVELSIPEYVFKKLRTQSHYLHLIKAITFLHQHQRTIKQSEQGEPYIESTLEDVAWANYLCEEALLRKSDELSPQLRSFFEELKAYLEETDSKQFLGKEVRKQFRLHPEKLKRKLSELMERGYIRQCGFNKRQGYEYEVLLWDDYEILQQGIAILRKNLQNIAKKHQISLDPDVLPDN